jgi:hypothetical protein
MARPRFDPRASGKGRGMPEFPEKRQSVRPPRRLLWAALVALAVLAAVWFAVAAATNEECPAERQTGAVSGRC